MMRTRDQRSEIRDQRNFFFLFSTICVLFLLTSHLSSLSSDSKHLIAKSKKTVEADKKDEETKVKKEPINESDFQPVLIGVLLENPQDYIGKKIKFRGKFSSFTTLALDYKPAMRASKSYISICIFRTDSKIPLSELKLAYPVKEAKEDQIIRELEEGDLLEIYGEVFSAALDEPWVDILEIKMIESVPKKTEDKEVKRAEKLQNDKPSDGKEVKKKKVKKSQSEND